MKIKQTDLFQLTFTFFFILIPFVLFGQSTDLDRVERSVEERIETGDLVGTFIGHISPEGKTTILNEGTLKAEGDTPVTGESIFEIGSISKVFTTLLLAQIMEEQGFSLEDEAESLLPESMVLPEFKCEKILVRHLVTHTSGLPFFPDNMFPEDSSNPYADYTLEQLTNYLRNKRLTRAPGTKFEYSNMGMALVGHILEEQTGREYEQLVTERIAKPLNMQSTGVQMSADDSSRLARGHSQGKTVANWDLPAFEGAGALISTGADMMIFLEAQMGIIKSGFYPAIQKTQEPLFDIKEGMSQQAEKIGMGWFYATDKDSIIWHTGGTGGYRAFIGINLETGSGAVVLSNSTAAISDIYFHLLDVDYALKETEKRVSISAEELDKFVGEYKSQMGFSFFVTNEDGELFIRLTGQKKGPVEPTSKNTFVNRQVAAEFTFDTTKAGDVSSVTLRQRGQKIPAKKISDKVSEPPKHKEISVDESVLRQFTGTYQLAPTFSIKVTLEDGQLYAQASGQQKLPVFPESETKFFYKVVEAQLEFIGNEDGEFNKVKLYQGGRTLKGNKIKN